MRIIILISIFIVSFSVVFGIGYLIIPREDAMMEETLMDQMEELQGDMEQMGGTLSSEMDMKPMEGASSLGSAPAIGKAPSPPGNASAMKK